MFCFKPSKITLVGILSNSSYLSALNRKLIQSVLLQLYIPVRTLSQEAVVLVSGTPGWVLVYRVLAMFLTGAHTLRQGTNYSTVHIRVVDLYTRTKVQKHEALSDSG